MSTTERQGGGACDEVVACAMDWHASGLSFEAWIEHARKRHQGERARLQRERDEALVSLRHHVNVCEDCSCEHEEGKE